VHSRAASLGRRPVARAHREGWQLRRGAVDDEEEPEQLVAALHDDVLPHAPADERLGAPVRPLQQQLRGRHLRCQRCRNMHTRCVQPACDMALGCLLSLVQSIAAARGRL